MTIKKINKKVIKLKPLSTRDKLVNAAIEHLNTHGREGMTVSKLAEDANVGYGTFYHYFKSPEDIFIAALEGSVSELSIQLRDYFKDEEDKLYVIMKSFQVMFRNLIDNPATPWLLTNPSHLVDVISNANAEHVYRDVGDIIQKNNMVYGDYLRYFDTKYRVMIWAILGGIDEVYRGKDRLEVEITVYKHLEYTLDLYGQKAIEIKERLSLDA
ncbi:MAG: TetR/AcrR family transcriptional regulator [SAR86 cluster bacterium]|nr:TetR/AcrR family transcriptional regulator [SAR86 cluster bacterium]